ncbi:hypothetical protein CAOG_010088 [Capsaspora owczarzaki ATCC 30864]|uniref:NOD3 protein n=1 Tax=Capsaspora owczarzaki (strain ATCC 30864) TaxID=595528 RepID=A0A0D2X544_CAPO3|nr:hypothetical protein CAOG_010088 [Capsaspora owczarzaki ATCC 30864]
MLSYQSMTQSPQDLYDTVKNASGQLSLLNRQIGEVGARAIAETLKVNKTLKYLDLDNNLIGDAGAQSIAEALKVNTTLKALSLAKNQIGDVGANAIAEALKVNKTLTWLDLGKSRIGNAGAQAIAEALKMNAMVTEIGLKQNQIGNAGAHAIAEALKVNTGLIVLYLNENEIGNAGAQAIAEALKVNSTLYGLFLEDNQIGDAGAQAIAEAFKVNPKLRDIFLKRNCISNARSQAINLYRSYDGRGLYIYEQVNPRAFSLLPRVATADDLQTVFCLLTSGPELKDQSTFLPALPAEIADIIMDEAQHWQGVQHTNRHPYDDRPVKVTVPQSINGNSTRVKTIQVVRDTGKLYHRIGDNVFGLIVRDEQGTVQYEHEAKATFVDSTLVSATLWPVSTPIIKQIRVGWQVQVQSSKSARDVRFESLVVRWM